MLHFDRSRYCAASADDPSCISDVRRRAILVGGHHQSRLRVDGPDGLVGSLPKPLLVFPAIWFIGYAVAAGLSHFEAHKLAAKVLSDNSGQLLPFDAQHDRLLIEADSFREDTSLAIVSLIESYDLNTVYQQIHGNPKCPNVQMVGLRTSGCGKGYAVVDKDINGCATRTNEIASWDGPHIKFFKGLCRVYAPAQSLHQLSHQRGSAFKPITTGHLKAGWRPATSSARTTRRSVLRLGL